MSAATPANAAPASSMSNGTCRSNPAPRWPSPGRRRRGHHGRRAWPRAASCTRCRPRSASNHGLQCGYCTPGMLMAAVDHRQPPWWQEARRGHGPARARRQHLPLHRLPQHRQGRARCRGPHEGRRRRGMIRGAFFKIDHKAAAAPIRVSRGRQPDQGETAWVLMASAHASSARKINRFITGKGRYVGRYQGCMDHDLRTTSCAARIRTPRSNRIDACRNGRRRRTASSPCSPAGMIVADDKVGGLICGWMIHSKDGSPMKRPARMADRWRRATVRVMSATRRSPSCIAETRNQSTPRRPRPVVDVTYERAASMSPTSALPSQRRRSRSCTPWRPGNTDLSTGRIGEEGRDRRSLPGRRPSRGGARPRQQPPGPQRHGAARGQSADYDAAERPLHALHDTSQNPHVARLVHLGLPRASPPSTSCASSRPTSAAASAPRSTSIPRRVVCALGLQAHRRTAGQMDRRPHRRPSLPTRTAAIT
jgi:hypothetical protein